jgi:hypothetical protein
MQTVDWVSTLHYEREVILTSRVAREFKVPLGTLLQFGAVEMGIVAPPRKRALPRLSDRLPSPLDDAFQSMG